MQGDSFFSFPHQCKKSLWDTVSDFVILGSDICLTKDLLRMIEEANRDLDFNAIVEELKADLTRPLH